MAMRELEKYIAEEWRLGTAPVTTSTKDTQTEVSHHHAGTQCVTKSQDATTQSDTIHHDASTQIDLRPQTDQQPRVPSASPTFVTSPSTPTIGATYACGLPFAKLMVATTTSHTTTTVATTTTSPTTDVHSCAIPFHRTPLV